MGPFDRGMTRLGRQLAEAQDDRPEGRIDLAGGRQRLLALEMKAEAPRGARRRPVARWMAAGLAAAALFAAALGLLVGRPKGPMLFELGATEPGVVGAWIAAPATAELPIRFSDGSTLRLQPGGRARVASVDADGAEVALESGGLELSVVHRERTHWKLRVGPFEVKVTGTRFETTWDPASERFSVALREGAITVSGPVVGPERPVHAGERISVACAERSLSTGSIEAPKDRLEWSLPTGASPPPGSLLRAGASASPPGGTAAAPSPALRETSPGPPPAPAPTTSAAASGAPSTAARPGPEVASARGPEVGTATAPDGSATAPGRAARAPATWQALAVEARYREALAAAELEGFEAICQGANASDLRALGDAARLGGSPGRATQALVALRRRFPGAPEAAAAAFLLGRLAQDQAHDCPRAVTWLAQYLSEQPGGSFAREAAGRLVQAEDCAGDEAGARRAAQRYLARYPDGSYAAYASRLLARAAVPQAP